MTDKNHIEHQNKYPNKNVQQEMRTNQEDRSRHKICPNLEVINKQNPGYPDTDFALGTDSDQK